MGTQILAHFKVGNSELPGALNIAGPETKLEIYSDRFFDIDREVSYIEGVSDAGKRISAINCVEIQGLGYREYYGNTMHYSEFFPNYIVVGQRYLDP